MDTETLQWVNFNSCVKKKIYIKLSSQFDEHFLQSFILVLMFAMKNTGQLNASVFISGYYSQ